MQNIHGNKASRGRFYYGSMVKLPTIKLPTFDGTYNSWLEFTGSFTALVETISQGIAIWHQFQSGDFLQSYKCNQRLRRHFLLLLVHLVGFSQQIHVSCFFFLIYRIRQIGAGSDRCLMMPDPPDYRIRFSGLKSLNQSLSDIQKCYYLRSALEKDAVQVIKSMKYPRPITLMHGGFLIDMRIKIDNHKQAPRLRNRALGHTTTTEGPCQETHGSHGSQRRARLPQAFTRGVFTLPLRRRALSSNQDAGTGDGAPLTFRYTYHRFVAGGAASRNETRATSAAYLPFRRRAPSSNQDAGVRDGAPPPVLNTAALAALIH
ncbi:hypothetical protein NQ318_023554 [Aromia moschata]|uniref:Uncharacterized protein n=1 Tax=Aromia moschata TaxID=1265417 RepID=A0AAV8YQ56_9CUCU|nr:hypothetical protein NQ318_023554 [Aromia moschata]